MTDSRASPVARPESSETWKYNNKPDTNRPSQRVPATAELLHLSSEASTARPNFKCDRGARQSRPGCTERQRHPLIFGQIPLHHAPPPSSGKQESHYYLNRSCLNDPNRSLMVSTPESTRPCKRPAQEQDLRPNTKVRHQEDRTSSASPCPGLHEQAFSHAASPAVGSVQTRSLSAGQHSAQRTSFSSPKEAASQPVNLPAGQPLSSQLLQRRDAEHKSEWLPAEISSYDKSANQGLKLLQGRDAEPKSSNEWFPTKIPSYDKAANQGLKLVLQPEIRPVTVEQLVNEIKAIYAGLVLVEKKCVEVCHDQFQSTANLSPEQWQALIALHRTLLQEHLDFFQATQHPAASPALRRLPTKYAMPARMWRHGIHSFLELLRHRLPHSLEFMLSFVYLAYQMMGLLLEYVPAFHETWIECLGDLARYRMAIEETDMRDREIWANVARMWYHRAADRSPTTGRIQHHLAVLARPNVIRQLFYYSKALTSGIPFVNTRDSIMLLFTPFLDKSEATLQKYATIERSFVTAGGVLFTRGSIHEYCVQMRQFISELDGHISRSGSTWKMQGSEVALTMTAWLFDFGAEDNFLWTAFCSHMDKLKGRPPEKQVDTGTGPQLVADPQMKEDIHRKFWKSGPLNATDFRQALVPASEGSATKFTTSDEVTAQVLPFWSASVSVVASKLGDRNILPFMHLALAFLWSLSYVPGALVYIESFVPWTKLVLCLNTLGRSGVVDGRFEANDFPHHQSGTGRQLPEDFLIRGFEWSYYYFPSDFFEGDVVDEDERTLELPSHAAPRAERCLWLGVRLAQVCTAPVNLFQKTSFLFS
ncbi:hypothetical protein HRR73_005488 [Exophiala dermatitidis]|nr:hypothetical protein HRR73_005488 [Exophiala dermatitidis]KAJ4643629.1 hypothetical protein HRR91_007475 [Exophiala dermatitidis]